MSSYFTNSATTTGNQEQGTSSKSRTVSTASKFNVGNQVRVQGDSKGTGKVGVPTAIALKSKKTTAPAAVNPDGVPARGTGKFRG